MRNTEAVSFTPDLLVRSEHVARSGRTKSAYNLTGFVEKEAWIRLHEVAKRHGAWWVKGAGWVFKDPEGAERFRAEVGAPSGPPPPLHVVPPPAAVAGPSNAPPPAGGAPRRRARKPRPAPAGPKEVD